MAVPVAPGNLLLFVGDSRTAQAYFAVADGLIDQINAQIPTVVAPRYSSLGGGATASSLAGGATMSTVADVTIHNVVRVVNSGVGGNKTADIAADVPGRITDHDPDVVVLFVGINDITFGVPLEDTLDNYESILTQIRAWSPTVPIVCVSELWYGEQWLSGPLRWSNTPDYDAAIDAVCSGYAALASTYSATSIDVRSPFLVYESVNNVPEPGARGFTSDDGLHPGPVGQLQLCNEMISSFTVIA